MPLDRTPASMKGYVSGARWHGIKEFLFDASVAFKVTVEFTDEDKGIIGHTVWYKLQGERWSVLRCQKAIEMAVKGFDGPHAIPARTARRSWHGDHQGHTRQ